MRYYKVCLFFGLVFLVSCNKEGAGCFDKAGNVKTVAVEVPTFTQIDVNSNVDVQLLVDGSDKVEIITGENLISGISLNVEDGVLRIDNLNTCFWSIGYTRPLVKIRNANLLKVLQHGYGNIFSTDTLNINSLSLQVEDASGGIDLLINANTIRLVSNALGAITLKGRCANLFASHAWGDGILYAKDLIVGDCSMTQSGSNRMELNVLNELQGSINNFGDVYLFGQKPATISVDLTSQGKIIEQY
ncbi:hypothetical protein MNBD_BACTEROID06-1122 [hydrothermal vent metagenome]|uniref:Putative auto-transporter adhesin head GIN domain-containing protein n=1 Tax=hydrothermal vent metagenome TaxID=652676 RepID=A0A3B0UBB7_9ZZZZ